MSRHFLAGVLAFCLGLTSIQVTPAQAGSRIDSEDVARAIAIGTAFFLLNEALNNGKSNVTVSSKHRPKVNHRILPRQCLRPVRAANTKYIMTRGCLKKNFAGADRLPKACRMDVKLKGKWRKAYAVRCLRHKGYKLKRS